MGRLIAMEGDARGEGRKGLVLLAVIFVIATAGMLWMSVGGGIAWLLAHARDIEAQAGQNRPVALAVYGLIAFVIQLLALPGGTVTVLSGGFLFGAPAAAAVYYLSQLAAAPCVFKAVQYGIGPGGQRMMARIIEKRLHNQNCPTAIL